MEGLLIVNYFAIFPIIVELRTKLADVANHVIQHVPANSVFAFCICYYLSCNLYPWNSLYRRTLVTVRYIKATLIKPAIKIKQIDYFREKLKNDCLIYWSWFTHECFRDKSHYKSWQNLGKTLAKPRAILAISAHWYVPYLAVSNNKVNHTTHDFYGFPPQLANFDYPNNGSPEFTTEIIQALDDFTTDGIVRATDWGLDHGVWSMEYIDSYLSLP